MQDLFLSRKEMGGWGAKPYGAARGGRKNVVPVRGNCSNNSVERKWVNLVNSFRSKF